MSLKNYKKRIGSKGEEDAVSYLKSNGYCIIDRNWRTKAGEIDIIGGKDNTIVFFEVKTLPQGNCDILAHVLNKRKQKRIIETAKLFLLNHREYNNRIIRFDVLVIDMPGLSPVYHIQDAFAELI